MRHTEPWHAPALIAAIAVVFEAADLAPLLRFEHALVGAEPWRLLTGNLVHLGWVHLTLNLAGLAIVWLLFRDGLKAWEWAGTFVTCSLAVGSGLLLFSPGVEWYVGLSGALHGLLVAGALTALRNAPRVALPLLMLVSAKIAWEQIAGGDAGTADLIGAPVIVDAHLYGALGGLLCGAFFARLRRNG